MKIFSFLSALLLSAILGLMACNTATDSNAGTPTSSLPGIGTQYIFTDTLLFDTKIESVETVVLTAIQQGSFMGRDRSVLFSVSVDSNSQIVMQYKANGDIAFFAKDRWLDFPAATHQNYVTPVRDTSSNGAHATVVNTGTFLGTSTAIIEGKSFPTSQMSVDEATTITDSTTNVTHRVTTVDYAPAVGFFTLVYTTLGDPYIERLTLTSFKRK
jgi:hypothetical protein